MGLIDYITDSPNPINFIYVEKKLIGVHFTKIIILVYKNDSDSSLWYSSVQRDKYVDLVSRSLHSLEKNLF